MVRNYVFMINSHLWEQIRQYKAEHLLKRPKTHTKQMLTFFNSKMKHFCWIFNEYFYWISLRVIALTEKQRFMNRWFINVAINLLCCSGFDVYVCITTLVLKGWPNGGCTCPGLGSLSGPDWRPSVSSSPHLSYCPDILIPSSWFTYALFSLSLSHADLRPPRSTLFWGQIEDIYRWKYDKKKVILI